MQLTGKLAGSVTTIAIVVKTFLFICVYFTVLYGLFTGRNRAEDEAVRPEWSDIGELGWNVVLLHVFCIYFVLYFVGDFGHVVLQNKKYFKRGELAAKQAEEYKKKQQVC